MTAVEKTKKLLEGWCYPPLREAAEAWLANPNADTAAKYVDMLWEGIEPIDDLIAMTESEDGIAHFGEERAKEMNEHAKAIKAAGGKYCDCPACTLALDLVNHKDELVK